MKVKAAAKLKKRRASNAKNPWYDVRPMNIEEVNGAKKAIESILKRHKRGIHYGSSCSPVDAILEKVTDRSHYGDRTRQRLVFQSVMDELKRLGAISYDPLRELVSWNPNTLVK